MGILKYIVLYLGILAILIAIGTAASPYEDCSVYGNCPKVISGGSSGSSSLSTSNVSFSPLCASNELAYYIDNNTIGCIPSTSYDNPYIDFGSKYLVTDYWIAKEDSPSLSMVVYGNSSFEDGEISPNFRVNLVADNSQTDKVYFQPAIGNLYPIDFGNSNNKWRDGWFSRNVTAPIFIADNIYANQESMRNKNGSAWVFGSGSGGNPFDQILNQTSSVKFTSITNLTSIKGINITISSTTGNYIFNGTELLNNKPATPINLTKAIFYYHLNNESGENTTFFKDFSGNGNNMTCLSTGCPLLNSSYGLINSSVQFDGSNDFAQIGDNSGKSRVTGDYTISLWLKMNSFLGASKSPDIIGKNDGTNGIDFGYTTWSGNNGVSISHMVSGSWACAGAIYPLTNADLNKWHHFVIVYNSSRLMTYVDGVLYNNIACTSLTKTTSSPWYLMRHYSNPASYGYLPANLDEVLVLNMSINSSDALAIYNYQKPFFNSTTVLNLTSRQGLDMTRLEVNVTNSSFYGGIWNGTSSYAISAGTATSATSATTAGSASTASYADECGLSYDSYSSSSAQVGYNFIDCGSHPSPAEGAVAFDFTNHKPVYHDGSVWVAFDGGATAC